VDFLRKYSVNLKESIIEGLKEEVITLRNEIKNH